MFKFPLSEIAFRELNNIYVLFDMNVNPGLETWPACCLAPTPRF